MSSKVTWLGHSALAIETGGYKLLVDPFLHDNPLAAADPGRVQADFILLSHGHFDHVGDTVAIASRTGATVISNVEIAGWVSKQKDIKTHGQQPGGGYAHPFGYLKLTLAVHGSILPDGSYGGLACGFLLTTLEGKDTPEKVASLCRKALNPHPGLGAPQVAAVCVYPSMVRHKIKFVFLYPPVLFWAIIV